MATLEIARFCAFLTFFDVVDDVVAVVVVLVAVLVFCCYVHT